LVGVVVDLHETLSSLELGVGAASDNLDPGA
jgi:hypothetical protein